MQATAQHEYRPAKVKKVPPEACGLGDEPMKEFARKPSLNRSGKKFVAAVRRHKKAIAQHRDALRALLTDLEAVCDSADRGVEELSTAIDTLSEYL